MSKEIHNNIDVKALNKICENVCTKGKNKPCLEKDDLCETVNEILKVADETKKTYEEILELYNVIAKFSEKEIRELLDNIFFMKLINK